MTLDILLDSSRLFGIKYFDTDFFELLFRLGLNMIISYIIILKVFQPTRRDSQYVFTYLVFSPVIFFICHLFATTELSIGFAFGLFAIFSMLRYRTDAIPVKEMTYMFVIIAVAVINAISTKKVSYVELFFTNFLILGLTFFLEKTFANKGIYTQIMMYEKIELVAPGKEQELIDDLKLRTGKDILRYDITETDYLKDSARIRIYFKK